MIWLIASVLAGIILAGIYLFIRQLLEISKED